VRCRGGGFEPSGELGVVPGFAHRADSTLGRR
jgi:hypothetical protein